MLKKMKKREKAKKNMFNQTNCDQKSQFSGIRTVKSTCLTIKKALNIQEKTLFT